MKHEQIARVAHEVNRAYCQALGDDGQPAWEDAPEWQRTSAINGVNMHALNPDAGPEASHEAWMQEKVDSGWVYGEVKDPEAKTHPCMVPFSGLPREQQAKDFIFRSVVHALMSGDDRLLNVARWAQATLTALNTGDVKKNSHLHLKLREVMIAYREEV